ncbi:MAG: hypothetical protein BZY68_00295 [SAR202 cluster bacterium MP-SAtl-SRR3965592-G2]|jgi:hypothetical protein|nr:MAG: hypothetical protein COB68_01105 [SAR202 cluster bacterium]PKB75266.1 MAG: hypothetical protein BZY68_00295 [SAR202 cluster bacterium MP-SAtl-SRR3965592-G2]PKB77333.1 MAG: hypothetical protein BZY70_03365 [SAR202 cluster bacterium MP-SInd-SRR3963457-G2]HIM78639.1 hypothetical protein [Dehalococcoidia bacterium]|tara:strand:+ start:117 stop:509 length:393 start_codon:yes stop_codon:yes gene_type:complete
MATETARINRYRSQSLRLLDNALGDMRGGRWAQSEDLLWGSLTLAVKAVALSRGQSLNDDKSIREYAEQLGQERRDKRIRESFDRLAAFGESLQNIRESRGRLDRLFSILDDVASAVEQLWDLVPVEYED